MQRGNNERTQSRHDDEQTRDGPGRKARECREVEAAALTYTRAAANVAGTGRIGASRGSGNAGRDRTDDLQLMRLASYRCSTAHEFTDATRRLPARRCEAGPAEPHDVGPADHFASSARTWSNSLRQSGSVS